MPFGVVIAVVILLTAALSLEVGLTYAVGNATGRMFERKN